MSAVSAEEINQLLPQTQCGKCGFNGCMPYAKAIAAQQAQINQCPPGGQETIQALAKLLNDDEVSLNPEFGIEKEFRIAKINEDLCIGCVKCIRACPVDAIVGAAKLMHVVIEDYCTGCELCIAPCPVDCIDLVEPPKNLAAAFSGYDQDKLAIREQAKSRYNKRLNRLEKQEIEKQAAREDKQRKKDRAKDIKEKQAFIKEAIKRSQSRRE